MADRAVRKGRRLWNPRRGQAAPHGRRRPHGQALRSASRRSAVSATRTGNFIGIAFFLVGLLVAGFATYTGLPTAYLWGGFGMAVFGAGIWRPKEMKEGAAEFRENAG